MWVACWSGTLPKGWHSHSHCAVCGPSNRRGLSLKFHLRPDGIAEAHSRITSGLQGYAGIVQGGVTAAMLDSAMVNCIWLSTGLEAVTAEMSVRYMAEIPVGAELRIEGRLLRQRKGLFWTMAQVWVEDKEMARAEGKFLLRLACYG